MADPDPGGSSPIDFGILAAGALGFTVALAWNDAVSVAVRGSGITPGLADVGVGAAILHAAVVTALVVVIAFVINSIARAAHAHERLDVRHERHERLDVREREEYMSGVPESRGAGSRSIVRLWSPEGQ